MNEIFTNIKNYCLQLLNIGMQIQNMSVQIPNTIPNLRMQMKDMGVQISNIGSKIFNIINNQNQQNKNNLNIGVNNMNNNNMLNEIGNMEKSMNVQNNMLNKLQTNFMNEIDNYSGPKIKIIFKNGEKTTISTSIETTMGNLLKLFIKKKNLGSSYLNNNFFIYNLKRINTNDNTTIVNYGIKNGDVIFISEKYNLLGGP